VITRGQNIKQDIGLVSSGNNMPRLIHSVQKELQYSISNIDDLRYDQNFDYKQSKYVHMSFPELSNIDIFNIVPKPPSNAGVTTKKEISYISTLTQNRTSEQIKLVYDVDEDANSVFNDFIDSNNLIFPDNKFATLYNLVVQELIDHLKYYYNRPRPFQIAEFYKIPIDIIRTGSDGTPAYPSGHTMYAGLAAEILSEKYPEKRQSFRSLAKKCGHIRVLQGVHYPSDNKASLKIIQTIYPILSKYYEKIQNSI